MENPELLGYQQQPRYNAAEMAQRRRDQERAAAIDNDNANEPDDVAPEIEDPDPEGRLLDASTWCECGHCNEVPKNASIKMCICCQEQDFHGLTDKLDSPTHTIACITMHRDFNAVCLTEAVLEMMEALTRERRGYGVNEDWTNRLYRLLSYQAYTFWIHQRLGKKNRRVIPACVVNSIREKWPEEDDNNYVSYKDADVDEIGDAWAL